MKRVNTSFRSVHSLHGWLQFPSKKCSLSARLVTITLKEVSALFMTGYNYTKRSVHSLHGWLQSMKRVNTSLRGIVTSHEESGHFFSIIVTSHAESEHFF
jgi:hypothetical protein